MSAQKVVICDDAGFIREILRQALEELGYEVVAESANGKDVVQMVNRCQPNFLFLDLVLPEQNGMQACAQIREQNKFVKIIAMTSLEEAFARPQIEQAGCDAWLAKPFTKSQIQDVLWSFKKQMLEEAKSG